MLAPLRLPALMLALGATSAPGQQLKATEVATGLSQTVSTRAPAGDVHRLFLVDRAGRIHIIKDGVFLSAPFLDIHTEVLLAGEGGFLGLAFHPDYVTNGRFFVSFVDIVGADMVVREYRASANPDVADPTSGVNVFGPYAHPASIHYGSDLQFGPDGMLYYSLGSTSNTLPQSLGSYEGKMMRFDVDAPAPHVPVDNPYAAPGAPGLDLIWASGLRNPWRFTFDRLTGDLYIGDVGATLREEIDVQPATFGMPGTPAYGGGRNYGWPCMEGTLCTSVCACDPTGTTQVLPAFEVLHPTVAALIGGYVYRGSAIPGLQGHCFAADYTSGRVWSFVVVNGQATQVQERTAELQVGMSLSGISSFGEDARGELYMNNIFTGKIYRIDPVASPCPAPQSYCTTSPNSVGSGARIGSTGSASLASNELVLTAAHCPRNVAGVFFHGAGQTQIPFANGFRCVSGTLVRTGTMHTDEHGFARRPFDAVSAGMTPAQVRNFQFYYRNPAAGGALANLSDGLSVTFSP